MQPHRPTWALTALMLLAATSAFAQLKSAPALAPAPALALDRRVGSVNVKLPLPSGFIDTCGPSVKLTKLVMNILVPQGMRLVGCMAPEKAWQQFQADKSVLAPIITIISGGGGITEQDFMKRKADIQRQFARGTFATPQSPSSIAFVTPGTALRFADSPARQPDPATAVTAAILYKGEIIMLSVTADPAQDPKAQEAQVRALTVDWIGAFAKLN